MDRDRPGSPEPSCVSVTSRQSREPPIAFSGEPCEHRSHEERPEPAGSCCESTRSRQSRDPPLIFKQEPSAHRRMDRDRPGSPEPSGVSVTSRQSREPPIAFNGEPCEHRSEQSSEASAGQSDKRQQKDLDSTFLALEENIICFVKCELKRFKTILRPEEANGCEKSETVSSDEAEEEHRRSSSEAFFRLTLDFLRRMKEDGLADLLQTKHPTACQKKLKVDAKRRFQYLFEGIAKAGKPMLLNDVFTELYITKRAASELGDEHEVRIIEAANRTPARSETAITCDDIFKSESHRPVRTVLTKGVAGIGKTVLTQKFTLDWAEDKANQDVHFIFPFTFRELNVLRKKQFSLVGLVHYFFAEIKEAGICKFEDFEVVFILDGLDECRLPLDFHSSEILTDVTESTAVQVLLTNLIRGRLLPSAHLWITTRPAAANQIPADCVHRVTEVRGFTDPQKEEYFRRRFREEEQASSIISHIRRSQSLHIMCHIPVFCWITATVLDEVLRSREGGELPKTLTQMYIHFLVVHAKVSNVKYHGGDVMDPHWSPNLSEMIVSLGKLAFEHLQKGNLIFYESDLTECGIDMVAAVVYSGVFTQIFKEEAALHHDKVFCFVHLSVQEFLAAVYVDLIFSSSGRVLVAEEELVLQTPDQCSTNLFYETAVDKALQSPNGHLDLFLRFLLGLSLESNQRLLRGLLPQTGSRSRDCQETARYIKDKIKQNPSPEKSINLFYCLSELKDHSLVEQIQHFLNSDRLSTEELSHAQWSALVFILLSSGECLEEFDLKKYCATEEAFLHLLPVIKASQKSLYVCFQQTVTPQTEGGATVGMFTSSLCLCFRLSACNLGSRSCELLVTVLSSGSSCLTELDLSNNDLQDSGVQLLAEGLKSPHCKLEILRLSGCLITYRGCEHLASALSANPSHLRELDLSYNHPGELGVQLLSAGLQDPQWRLDTLRVDHAGERWLEPGLKKYACELSLDPNTANNFVLLSEDRREAAVVSERQPYPEHALRFQPLYAVACSQGLTGRCYWEVEREGWLAVAVFYGDMARRGDGNECRMGRNPDSWALFAAADFVSAWHDDRAKTMYFLPQSLPSRVAVFLDWSGGTVSFYKVTCRDLIHLHTFHAAFTQPLYPGFAFRAASSVRLCQS
ncbi:protein NLRC3-like isoform X2 [Salarias fasciatus]|nr:protein NLRC3-like isoform X2 [Salarias fasciatus]